MICYKCGKLRHVEGKCIQIHENENMVTDNTNDQLNEVFMN